jgi:hypothetical protein
MGHNFTTIQNRFLVEVPTFIMGDIWKHGFAEALDRGGNPFDEAVEKKWTLT